jgi:ribosomal protein S18 acetylase RimI-like enzyme
MYVEFEPKRRAQGLPPAGAIQLRRWLDDILPRGVHLVVEIDGRLEGHAMLIPLDGDGAELANFLHQSIRGRGIGTALNRAVLEEARAQGFRRVWLSVEPSNRAALRSYRSAGFHLLPATQWAQEVEMEVILSAA